jgi:hypothetical protein
MFRPLRAILRRKRINIKFRILVKTITLQQYIHYFHDYVAYLLLLKLTMFYILQLFLDNLKYIIQVDIKMYIKVSFTKTCLILLLPSAFKLSLNNMWYMISTGGTRQCSLLRHYATSRKVAGSSPYKVIGIFSIVLSLLAALWPWGWLSL